MFTRLVVAVALVCAASSAAATDLLKQSTAYTRAFLMVQSSDHLTGITGATVSCTLSKAGGTFAAAGGAITELANGWYKVALTTTDTNTLGDLAYHCTATSADPTDFGDQVIALDVMVALPANFAALSIDANGRTKALTGLTKNVALNNFMFMMTDSTTHAPKTGITGGSFTKQYSLDGAAFASLGGTITEVANGWYKVNLANGELNGNVVALRFAASGADDTTLTFLMSQ